MSDGHSPYYFKEHVMTQSDAIRTAVKKLGLRASGLRTNELASEIYCDYLKRLADDEATSQIKLGNLTISGYRKLTNDIVNGEGKRQNRVLDTLVKLIQATCDGRGIIGYRLTMMVRKQFQKHVGLVYDCRTYDGQPARDIREPMMAMRKAA